MSFFIANLQWSVLVNSETGRIGLTFIKNPLGTGCFVYRMSQNLHKNPLRYLLEFFSLDKVRDQKVSLSEGKIRSPTDKLSDNFNPWLCASKTLVLPTYITLQFLKERPPPTAPMKKLVSSIYYKLHEGRFWKTWNNWHTASFPLKQWPAH